MTQADITFFTDDKLAKHFHLERSGFPTRALEVHSYRLKADSRPSLPTRSDPCNKAS